MAGAAGRQRQSRTFTGATSDPSAGNEPFENLDFNKNDGRTADRVNRFTARRCEAESLTERDVGRETEIIPR